MSFLGARNDIPQILRDSDVLVLCSDDEGFPNVVVEAMAAGKPVVTTLVGDAPLVVADGETGYVVPFGNEEALVNRTRYLCENTQVRDDMGKAGRRRVENLFSYSSLGGILVAIYEQVLQQDDETWGMQDESTDFRPLC